MKSLGHDRNSFSRYVLPVMASAAIIALAVPGGSYAATSTTIATFANPALSSDTPLFTVDFDNGIITGGWEDFRTGLDLEVPITGHIHPNLYQDAFFTITDISYEYEEEGRGLDGGDTGGGTIKFYADGADPDQTEPLIRIDFESGYLAKDGVGLYASNVLRADDVEITGSQITGVLSGEIFTFSFDNHQPLNGSWDNGFTATAAFTCSAVPEPATIGLLAMGALLALRKKHRTKI